ncbi:MAG: hypothetical protein EHM93_16235 [Bacteroidales bacterium]|nr:MAG: hypothetical protein EHM93_16235 [Bacteroidales bacterium]
MEPLYIDFSDSDSLSGKLKFMGITMTLIGLASTIFCLFDGSSGFFLYISLFWLIYGIAMLTPYPYRISTHNKPFIKVDDTVIEFRTTPFSLPKKEAWQTVSCLTIKPRSLYLETADNRRVKINLSWISHRNVLVIKQTMRDYAASKGLEVIILNG